MSPRAERFAKEYTIDHNATQAAIRAGYSPKGANRKGSELLKKPEVKQKVAETTAEVAARLGLDAAYVLKGFKDNFERAMTAVEVLDKDGNGTGEYRYDGNVANKALEMLGKTLQMFVEKSEVAVQVQQVPVIRIHGLGG
jgi:phage terminase small subunit